MLILPNDHGNFDGVRLNSRQNFEEEKMLRDIKRRKGSHKKSYFLVARPPEEG